MTPTTDQSTSSILSRALTPREPQVRLATFLDGATRQAIAIQADTGTGKTAVLLAAAITHAKADGGAVIVSTHTLQLLRQLQREADRFQTEGVTIGTRLGMRNFASASRVDVAWGRSMARDTLTADDDAAFAALMGFARNGSGLIEDFVADYGELPAGLAAADIALLPSAREADKAAWRRAREATAAYQITIQTHALTLAQSRFGELPPVVIFDEADALGEVADGADDRRLSLSELQVTMKYAAIDTAPLDSLLNDPRNHRLREQLADHLKVAHQEEEVRHALSDARRVLTAHRLESARRGTEVRREGNDIVIRSLWADRARWIWRGLLEAGVERAIFASATLAVGDQVALSLRRYGVPVDAVEHVSVSPRRFGSMTFNLIHQDTPPPIRSGEVNEEWREAVVHWLQQGGLDRSEVRPLVLAKSYADATYFGQQLGLEVHQRGQPLATYLEQFRSGKCRGLVTPAGWAGVDLPGLITDLVILRLPFAGVDELRDELLGRTNFVAIKAAMQRKLKQGLGRGVRKEDDEVRVWLADPRVHEMRMGVLAAVPERFRDEFLRALGRLRTTDTPVRPEQAAFRQALLDRYGACMVTGCTVEAALEAAHLPGRSWKAGHNRPEDGILLRADIHALLDNGAMRIDEGFLRVDPSIAAEYGQFDGQRVLPFMKMDGH